MENVDSDSEWTEMNFFEGDSSYIMDFIQDLAKFKNELKDNGIEADDSKTLELLKVYLLGLVSTSLSNIAENTWIFRRN